MWPVILSALSVCIAVGSLAVAFLAARNVDRALSSPHLRSDYSKLQLQSLKDSLSEQAEALELLANRVKMQRVRTAATHVRGSPREPDGEPDAVTDPEGWRAWKNKQLRNPTARSN